MAKLESSLKNMILSLTTICVVAAGLLAGVYMVTADPIAKAAEAKTENAKLAVLNGQEGQALIGEADGFGGKIKVMVGLAADGTILGYEVLDQQETPGLGTHCVEWFKNEEKPGQNIIGRKAGNLTVSKDGGEVDAITAATISSRAFLKAVNSVVADADANSGATQMVEHPCKGDGSCGHCQHDGEHKCCHEAERECAHECEHHCNHVEED